MKKLILVIVRDDSHETLVKRLLDADFGVTDIASIGGFLRKYTHTLT